MADKIQVTLRLDPELHEQLKREAPLQDRSVASLVIQYCRRGLAQDQRQRESEDQ